MLALAGDRPQLRAAASALGDRRAHHHRAGDPARSATGSATASSPAPARAIFCAAMIVGRMEALVIIALFNPSYWRQ